MLKGQKGFTLIELIVTIAIISILASVAVPSMANILDNAKTKTDMATLKMLNDTTRIYGVMNNICDRDIFDGINSDDERMQVLVDAGYYKKAPEPQEEDEKFYWYPEHQLWYYTGTFVINDGSFYLDFKEIDNLSDYVRNFDGKWVLVEEGLEGDKQWNNLLFIPNENDEYIIRTTASLLDEDNNHGNGYGVLFDTILNVDENGDYVSDVGYCVQFDRGFGSGDEGAIVLRGRDSTSGSLSEPLIKSVSQADIESSLGYSIDSEWWMKEHDLQIVVNNSPDNPDKKLCTIMIKDEINNEYVTILENQEYDNITETSDSSTGFRVWGSDTLFDSIEVESLDEP